MAVRKITPDLAYGIGDALIPLAPIPIVAHRNPGAADLAQLGTTWINSVSSAVWVLSRVAGNSATWVTSPVLSGAGVFTSLQTTVGGLTVDLGAGGIDVGTGNFSVDNSGNVIVGGDLSVAGTFTFTGDLNLTSAALIDLTSTLNAAPSILFAANGGASEQILLHSMQGTSATSIELLSDLGGITVSAARNTAAAVNLVASNAAGGVTASAGTGGITLAATNGAIALTSGTGAINIGADAASHAMVLGNSTGTTSIALNTGTGSSLNLGTNAIAHTVTVGNNTGASSVVVNVGTGAASFGANATDHTTTVGSTTGASSTVVQGGTAGVSLAGPKVVLPGPVNILTGAGAPANGLAVNVGDMYINTTAASAVTRLYIATAASTWTNVTCAA